MPEPTETEVLRQLAAVRRELRLVRALLVFVSVLLAVVFLPPMVMTLWAGGGSYIPGFLAPALGIGLAVTAAALVASRFAPPRSREDQDV